MKKLSFLAMAMFSILLIAACNNQKSGNSETQSQNRTSTPGKQETSPSPQQITKQRYLQAALNGNFNTVKQAIDNDMDINATNQNENSALMLAAYNGHKKIVDFLLQKGADVNRKDANQRTALIYAASGNNAKTVQSLIDAGADLNHTDKAEQFTALMFAASEGQTEVVEVLLNAGADKSIKDKDGETALDFARKNGHNTTAELLAE